MYYVAPPQIEPRIVQGSTIRLQVQVLQQADNAPADLRPFIAVGLLLSVGQRPVFQGSRHPGAEFRTLVSPKLGNHIEAIDLTPDDTRNLPQGDLYASIHLLAADGSSYVTNPQRVAIVIGANRFDRTLPTGAALPIS